MGLAEEWKLIEVYGLEPDLLSMVPHNCAAVLLLYPYEAKAVDELRKTLVMDSMAFKHTECPIWHSYQFTRGACGAFGLLHAVANNTHLPLDKEKVLFQLVNQTSSKTPAQRAQWLNTNQQFDKLYQECTTSAESAAPVYQDDERLQGLHFVAFVHVAGGLYEMDGLSPAPIYHGSTSPDTLLHDTATAIKKYIDCDPTDVRYTLMALVKE